MKSDRFKHIRRVILSRVLLVPFVPVMLVFGTLVYNFATTLRTQVGSELVRIAEVLCSLGWDVGEAVAWVTEEA